MAYSITAYTKRQATKYGVKVKPSKVKGKKIDVFKGDKKVASVGAIGYNDYPTYIRRKEKSMLMKGEDCIRKDILKIELKEEHRVGMQINYYGNRRR